ncbi:MAG: D-glycero-beta-D-manno-heptose 1-phosphate adenylyltransferase [Candidatus Kapabacteria bacterium]|nr:D-glycero-beta-D-manno-heptose 1-phosphate adenylyltransferase [Candidatus Kapabacteria bacterium]
MLIERNNLKAFAKQLHDKGVKIAFTNGCFDIIHSGHVIYLNEAKKLADILMVGLNSDESVRRLKGASRPVNNEIDREIVLGNLKAVDYVVIFEEDTPINIICDISPDFLVKGGDYSFDTIVGADFVRSKGGEVLTIPLVEGKSTTQTIKNMII